MKIKLANKNDIPKLIQWIEKFYEEEKMDYDEPNIREALELLFNSPELGRAYLLKEKRKEIGYMLVTFGWSLEFHGRDSFIDEIYIIKSERGRGLAHDAIKILENILMKEGIKTIHLEVNNNEKAIILYNNLGFIPHKSIFLSKRL